MKLDFSAGTAVLSNHRSQNRVEVCGETRPLAEVALCPPRYLEPVPCCSVTREALREGHETDRARALQQHGRLRQVLAEHGVTCHLLPAAPGASDMCFTRDVGVATPMGLVALKPALEHRSKEVDHLVGWARSHLGAPVRRIAAGRIEGGDVCIARPGLLIVGVSGARTDEAGAAEFCQPFRAEGWDVLVHRFDEHFLHLDTIFCMLEERRALACVDVLDDGFLEDLACRGIELLPVSYKEARQLGCNAVSLDGRTIVAGAATPRVSEMMRREGFEVAEVELDQFTACGGGVHCLTMPIRRG